MGKYDTYFERVEKLHAEGKTNAEISREIGIDSRRVSDLIKNNGLLANKRRFNENPTQLQKEVFISAAIGDGAIYKSNKNINYRMNLAHSDKQKHYFLMKYNIVKDFIGTEYFRETQFHKRANKEYHCYKFQSKVNPFFTKLRERFYKDGKKIIPKDLERDITPRVLAYKFFDDGHKTTSGYSISMDDYDGASTENLRMIMKDKFDIKTNIHDGGKKIYIPASERYKFKNIISPFATKDLHYKL